DERWKMNIRPVPNLDAFDKIDAHLYDWKDPTQGKEQIGFVAQEVLEYLPHNGDGAGTGKGNVKEDAVRVEPVVRDEDTREKLYQFRALSRKALSYQKRQWFTNICCIGLCPALMVLQAAFLGAAITKMIQNGNDVRDLFVHPHFDLLFCSNTPSLDTNGLPIYDWNRKDLKNSTSIPSKEGVVVYLLNFFNLQVYDSSGPPGASRFGSNNPRKFSDVKVGLRLRVLKSWFECVGVYWFGENYPRSDYYSAPTNITNPLYLKDSTYIPQPTKGWFGMLLDQDTAAGEQAQKDDAIDLRYFTQFQLRPWAIVAADPSIDLTTLGITLQRKWSISELGNLPPYFTAPGLSFKPTNGTNASVTATVPYFTPDTTVRTTSDMDDRISDLLKTVFETLTQMNKTAVTSDDNTPDDITRFFATVNSVTSAIPYARIYLSLLHHPTRRYKYTLHIGTDIRLQEAAAYPQRGKRLFLHQSQLSNALLRTSNPTVSGATSITQGVWLFPQVGDSKVTFPFIGLLGRILFPFGVSFLLPVFVVVLVREKEERVVVMIRMNGVKSTTYYLSHYLTFLMLYFLSTLIFFLVGSLITVGEGEKITFFTRTDPAVLVIMFVLWGNVQVGMAFVFSSVFSRSRNALVVVFLIVLCGVMIAFSIDELFTKGRTPPTTYFIWPPFAFYCALRVVNGASFEKLQRPYRLSFLTPGDQVFTDLIFLAGETVVLFLLAVYLSNVVPTEFGVRRVWHYPQPVGSDTVTITVSDEETRFEDEDVKAERHRVFDILWDNLTCGEPLYFYARLKGFPACEERAAVLASLDTVALRPFEHRLTKGLSGGEKRRLSIAIALVGRPKVVFLDEPMTGLDPEVRRLIWNIITSARSGKTIILTTHWMEEAEVCCQCIRITAKGTLRCLGSPLHLKSRYGRGFKLSFACTADSMHGATGYVEGMLTEVAGQWRKVDAFATNTSYEFAPREEGDVGVVFARIEEAKERVGVVDWGLTQTTLEEVFLRIISEADANAD
ncbi:hypothetical protein HK104_002381, partial [Borealophlyctis nickersoniae]